jgi:succinoglycan biosynthesis transport protein ExoP
MPNTEGETTLRDYWRVVVRRKWIVAAAVLMALIGSVLMSLLQDPIYEAEAQMLVEPRSGQAVFQQDPTLNVQNLDRAIQTEIQVLEGQRVRARVQSDLGLDELPPEVNGTPVGSTDVVSVEVRSKDAGAAQELADAYVSAYTATRREQAVDGMVAAGAELQAKIDELQAQIVSADDSQRLTLVAQQATFKERLDQLQIDSALTTGGASVVKSAELPTDPVDPQPLRSAALAVAIGLLLGLGAAFLVDYLDDSIRSPADLEGITDHPVLAVVPVEPPPDNRPIAVSEPHEFAVEIYRGLRTNVQFLALDAPLKVIQVTSSLPGEGKTTTAANLAVVLSQAGHQVVFVDADLRKPRAHEVFLVPPVPGLTEVLLGEPVELVVNHLSDGMRVVAAGQVPPNPSEMMSNARVGEFLRELADRYDYVILDSPPALPVSDAVALARWVDGVLVVAQADRVSRRDVAETVARLDRVGAPVFGLVLNRARGTRSEGGSYGYGYGYGYGRSGPAGPAMSATHVAEPSREAIT